MKALVVFSGGLDSTLCLIKAINQYKKENVLALFFSYGQKHIIEMEQAKIIAEKLDVQLEIFEFNVLAKIGNSELICNKNKETSHKFPPTFVPMRNIIFLTIASSIAYKQNIDTIITGVCANDFAGYPDCRENTIKSLQDTLSFAVESRINIITPLLFTNKSKTIKEYYKLNMQHFIELTHSCYNNIRGGCGHCGSCIERNKALNE